MHPSRLRLTSLHRVKWIGYSYKLQWIIRDILPAFFMKISAWWKCDSRENGNHRHICHHVSHFLHNFCLQENGWMDNCDPLPQNQEQVLFYINWVIGFIRRARLSSLFLSYIWRCDHLWSKPFNFPQKYIVRKWQSKFTFYIDIINRNKSWKCMI